jgi:hypothetical protein
MCGVTEWHPMNGKMGLTLCLTLMYLPGMMGYLFRSSYSSHITWQYVH